MTELTAEVVEEPIPMVLHCPACGLQHVDEPRGDWTNPPHRSHLCEGCGHIWRPADVPTTGVADIQTKGANDSPLIIPALLSALKAQPYQGQGGERDPYIRGYFRDRVEARQAVESPPPPQAIGERVATILRKWVERAIKATGSGEGIFVIPTSHACTELASEILALLPAGMGEWRGIESAPRGLDPVIGSGPRIDACEAYPKSASSTEWYSFAWDGTKCPVILTHWMPFPAPPGAAPRAGPPAS